MRFLQTADWQIGMRAAGLGQAGARVRQERLTAAERADFLLLAGDTFEDNGVERHLVQRVGDILAAAGREVFLIPGNHDPAVPGSVWEHSVWRSAANLHVLTKAEPIEWQGALLYPCPALERSSDRDPTEWISGDRGGRFRIGMAHGTVEGIRQDAPDYPIRRDAPGRCSLDYLALGHWHSTVVYDDGQGAPRMAYCGTHATTRFGERARAPGRYPPAGLATGNRGDSYRRAHLGADERGAARGRAAAAIRQRIDSLDRPDSTLLAVRLSGVLPAAAWEEVERIAQILQSRFLFARLDTQGRGPAPEDDSWLAGLPAGAIRDTVARLRQLACGGEGGEIAARALVELYAIAAEVGR